TAEWGSCGTAGSEQSTILGTSLPVFQCPSDGGGNTFGHACRSRNSYLANSGVGYLRKELPPSHTPGVFYQNSGTRFRDLVDGSSNTAGFSEIIKVPQGFRGGYRGAWSYGESCHYQHDYPP